MTTKQSDWVCCCGAELDGSHDHNSCGPPEPRPEPDRPQLTGDLAMLIYRLVRQVRKHEQNNPVANSALDYLQRQGILLDPLRSGGEVVTSEEIQADAEAQVVPREIADRLAEALANIALTNDEGTLPSDMANAALDEYRKAVTRG